MAARLTADQAAKFGGDRSVGWRKPCLALGAGLLLALSGCKSNDFDRYKIESERHTEAEQILHPNQITPGSGGLPVVSAAPSPSPGASAFDADDLDAADDSAADPSDRSRDSSGKGRDTANINGDEFDMSSEKDRLASYTGGPRKATHSWWGVFDIYWKLNWARIELLTGAVPRNLAAVIARERRHSDRLAHETRKYNPEPYWKLSPGLTIADCLEPTDLALAHIDAGINHIKQRDLMEAGGVSTHSIPWGQGETEVRNALERMGLVTPASKGMLGGLSRRSSDDDDSRAPIVTLHAQTGNSERQQAAADIALRYEKEFRASPEESARQEFEEGLRQTLKLRDTLNLRYVRTPNHLMSDDVLISGPLHMAGSESAPEPAISRPALPAVSFDAPVRTP